MSKNEVYFCVHGHFYQPPRENPWTGVIDKQPSANPFPNWNDRIFHECYMPNMCAPILDTHGKVVEKVNNYELMSFNYGPTLISWMQKKYPKVYDELIKADQRSQKEHLGHGNAIAQSYNHIIMPLANERDKITQVVWGIEDFKFHFKRQPEAMWLSETACDDQTMDVLMEYGMKYVILEPSQASFVRSMELDEWTDVTGGRVDTRRPYRYYSKANPGNHIDVFFYDGPVSKEVSFGGMVFDAQAFANKLESTINPNYGGPQLIHIATDGETYGHHKKNGEMGLAYLLKRELPKRGYKVVNYAEFLEISPPRFEVRLNNGEDGEGTAWSCSHGVKRWRADCGCSTGGHEHWNQKWRAPLRNSLDNLRNQCIKLFAEKGGQLFYDPWIARNDYIKVINEPCDDVLKIFWIDHLKVHLTEGSREEALDLLKMQHNCMLMYTSCGWFFNDVSGIETLQILAYAAIVIELYEKVSGKPYMDQFLDQIEYAKSNIPEWRNGKYLFKKIILPLKISKSA